MDKMNKEDSWYISWPKSTSSLLLSYARVNERLNAKGQVPSPPRRRETPQPEGKKKGQIVMILNQ